MARSVGQPLRNLNANDFYGQHVSFFNKVIMNLYFILFFLLAF